MKSPMTPVQAADEIYVEPVVGPFRGRRGLIIAGTDTSSLVEWREGDHTIFANEHIRQVELDPSAAEAEVVACLPCPFCGQSDLEFSPSPDTVTTLMARCGNGACILAVPLGFYRNLTEFAERWNVRALTEAS